MARPLVFKPGPSTCSSRTYLHHNSFDETNLCQGDWAREGTLVAAYLATTVRENRLITSAIQLTSIVPPHLVAAVGSFITERSPGPVERFGTFMCLVVFHSVCDFNFSLFLFFAALCRPSAELTS